jgi:protein-S-isoprenylcysteine O-methyltransferase Ste14
MPVAFKIGLWNAWVFMSIFLLQMIAIFLIDKRSWERGHLPKEVKRNKLERNAGIVGNVMWLLTMIYSIFLPLRLGTIWFYVGLSFFMVGSIFLIIATHNFITTPADKLIKKGVYKISRHPMYFATFLICLGSGIAAKSWLFISFSIIMALCFYPEALLEEKYCLDRYGSDYQEYKKRTPRLIGVPKKY